MIIESVCNALLSLITLFNEQLLGENLMEIALWVLIGIVTYFGIVITQHLRSINGKLNGLRGLLSSDGPDPEFTSYCRMAAGSLSAIKSLLDQVIDHKNKH
jgi:hypothetical protein